MSESVHLSPLDKTRDIEEWAIALGLSLQETPMQREEVENLSKFIQDLNEQHPLKGQEVAIEGTSLVLAVDTEGVIQGLSLPPIKNGAGRRQKPLSSSRGTYDGLAIHSVYDPEQDTKTYMVLHTLVSLREAYLDAAKQLHTVTHYTFVVADGVKITPDVPINMHSLQELQEDRAICELDKIAFAEDASPADKLRLLGSLANKIFANDAHRIERNMQRVSYLNSLNLLDGVMVVSRDVALADKELLFTANIIECSDLSEKIGLQSAVFDIAPGYKRMKNGLVVPDGPPELYGRGLPTKEGKIPFLPLKNIISAVATS